MARKPRETTYYIEINGRKCDPAYANRVICGMLAKETATASNSSATTDILLGVECRDSKKRDLYRVPSGVLFMLWNSRDSLKISFKVFSQEGKGQIRDVTAWYKKRHERKGSTRSARF